MRNHLKIGIYSNQYAGLNGEGGIGTYTRSLAVALAAQDHEVNVLTPGLENSIGRPQLIDGVHLHTIRRSYLPVLERVFPGARAAWSVGAAARQLVRDYQLDLFEFPNWEGRGRY